MNRGRGGWEHGGGGGWHGNHEEWNRTVGSVPPGQFRQASYEAINGMDRQAYMNHVQAVPFGNFAPQQQSGLAQTIISALLNHGANQQTLQQYAGVNTLDPNQMSPQQIAALLQYAHQNQPQALAQVASQYQNQPDLLHSILGNQGLTSIIENLAGSYLSSKL